jgi:hypothetical protein
MNSNDFIGPIERKVCVMWLHELVEALGETQEAFDFWVKTVFLN